MGTEHSIQHALNVKFPVNLFGEGAQLRQRGEVPWVTGNLLSR